MRCSAPRAPATSAGTFRIPIREWKDASSLDLLRRASPSSASAGFAVVNVDVVVVLERPKIAPFLDAIRDALADALGIDATR